MPRQAPIEYLSPLFGVDALADAAAAIKTADDTEMHPSHPGLIAMRQTLILIRAQLEPLDPLYATSFTFGRVTALSKRALYYVAALDGGLECEIKTAADDYFIRTDGWILGVATREHFTDEGFLDISDEDLWPIDLHCLDLTPSVPDKEGDPTTDRGILIPIRDCMLFDSRPRMN